MKWETFPGGGTVRMVSVRVATHWLNGWFLRLFARPCVVIEGHEHPARWGEPVEIELPDGAVQIGAGVRYFNKGPLLGCEPAALDLKEGPATSARDGKTVGSESVVLRNGPWNHSPFRVVS